MTIQTAYTTTSPLWSCKPLPPQLKTLWTAQTNAEIRAGMLHRSPRTMLVWHAATAADHSVMYQSKFCGPHANWPKFNHSVHRRQLGTPAALVITRSFNGRAGVLDGMFGLQGFGPHHPVQSPGSDPAGFDSPTPYAVCHRVVLRPLMSVVVRDQH